MCVKADIGEPTLSRRIVAVFSRGGTSPHRHCAPCLNTPDRITQIAAAATVAGLTELIAGALMHKGLGAVSGTSVAAVSPSPDGMPIRNGACSRSGPTYGEHGAHCSFDLRPRSSDGGNPFTAQQQTWPGIVATVVRIQYPISYDFRFEGTDCCIALLDLYRADGTTQIDGRRLSHVKDMRNRLTFLPSGCDFSGWTRLALPGEFFAVQIARETATQRGIDLERLPPRHGFSDQAVRTIMRRLRALFDDASLNRPGYAETLADLLCFELERAMSQQTPPALQQGGLTARQVRIVTDYMEDHLAEKIAIADLAALLGLTRFHFIRSFQQSVGLPPHQFLIRCRIERARGLLSEDTLNIADVADQSGFRGTVQLTRAFRRVVGTTPSRYRRELK